MKNKLSSYQKLKAENKSLKEDIYNLVMIDDRPEGSITRGRWLLQFKADEIMWFGDSRKDKGEFKGIINKT